jgi:hypothetical protein
MKRHPALQPLSNDHHHGLVMALRFKKGGPASPNDNWPSDRAQQIESPLAFARNELLPHFEIEETHLLGCVHGCEELEARLKSEHAELRQMLSELTVVPAERATELLQALGAKLEAHIRFEEREYFPRLQELLGEEGMARLAAILAR